MIEQVNKLHNFLLQLSEALSTTKVTKTTNITVEQVMFGTLEKIEVGDNSTVVINQNVILSVDSREIIDKSLILLEDIKAILPSPELPLSKAVAEYRRRIVCDSMRRHDRNKKIVAKQLGTSERSVRYYSGKEYRDGGGNDNNYADKDQRREDGECCDSLERVN